MRTPKIRNREWCGEYTKVYKKDPISGELVEISSPPTHREIAERFPKIYERPGKMTWEEFEEYALSQKLKERTVEPLIKAKRGRKAVVNEDATIEKLKKIGKGELVLNASELVQFLNDLKEKGIEV